MPSPTEPALADDLTGALNRRYLRQLFEQEWPQLVAERGRIALLLLDLDEFKPVNDRFGHLTGDAVLRAVASRLKRAFRDGDLLVRYGGDEFVVVLPGAGAEEARALAERARAALAADAWIDPATGEPVEHRVSFSIGVAAAPDDGVAGDELLALADRRLYVEKNERKAALARHRLRLRVALVAGALAVATVLAVAGLRYWPLRPAAPQVGAPASTPAVRATADRDEIQALRAEVARLTAVLSEERSADERERYQQRIRELEATLARAESGASGAVPAPADAPSASPPPGGSGVAAAPATSALLPADAAPGTRVLAHAETAEAAGSPAAVPAVGTTAALIPPQLVSHRPPLYPPLALARKVEATVALRVAVTAEGRVAGVEPIGPPKGYGFDEAARRAALSAVYRPATRGGAPVAAGTTLEIRFVLADQRR